MESNQNPAQPAEHTDSIFTENEFSMDGYDKHIRQARNALYGAAIVLLINLFIMMGTIPQGYE